MTKKEERMIKNFKAATEYEAMVLDLRNKVKEMYETASEYMDFIIRNKVHGDKYYAAQKESHESFKTLEKLDGVVLEMAKEKEAKERRERLINGEK